MISTTISISDLLTLLLVILTFFYVRYQKKLTSIAEKELKIKINDINDLIKKIERERQDREAQIRERIDAEERIWLYSNDNNKNIQNTSRDRDLININHLDTLHLSNIIIAKTLDLLITQINDAVAKLNPGIDLNVFKTSTVLGGIISHNISQHRHNQIASEFISDQIKVNEQFDEKYQQISSSTDNLELKSKNLIAINKELNEALIITLNKLKLSLVPLETEFKKSKEELKKAVEMMIGEQK